MTFILLAALCSFLLSPVGRDRLLIAALDARLGRRASLWAIALGCTAATLVLAAWVAGHALTLPDPTRRLASSLALVVAAIQCLRQRPPPIPAEPTRSLGAITLVLLVAMMVDPVRLMVVALGTAGEMPGPIALAAAGGLMPGWLLAARIAPEQLPAWRHGAGICLIVGALAIALA